MKYILAILISLFLILPSGVKAAQTCEVPSNKIAEYNRCQIDMPDQDCDKQYRTLCRGTSAVDSVFGIIRLPGSISSIPRGAEGINNLIRVGIDLLFIVGAVMSLFFVIWGAIDYMSAGGRKDGAAEARKKITYALIGLMLLGLSFFIVRFVGMIVGLGDFFNF